MSSPAAVWLLRILGGMGALAFLGFAWVSWHEGESRAARLSALLAAIAVLLTFFLAHPQSAVPVLSVIAAAAVVAVVLFVWPVIAVAAACEPTGERHDERDVMFARARLTEARPEYQAYYLARPENKTGDDALRANPGLLSPRAALADPILFAAAQSSFAFTEALHDAVDGPVAEQRTEVDPLRLTGFMKDLARFYGAVDVGVAELKPFHVYSHVGRGWARYGQPIAIDHTRAIAFTVEMDFRMMGAGPAAPTVMESARQYVESARVAVQVAAALRGLGFPARAHIDGNYRVIAPLVAREAGLGEIGRIGLLMTGRLGPRVRLSAVTTTAPLTADPPTRKQSVIDFCRACRKCAESCPAKAIPVGDRSEDRFGFRWRLDSEACYRYWTVVGTDCGRCVSVCPFSHPDNLAHNLVRWGIERSGEVRRAALRLDDVFYGRRPRPKPFPVWTRIGKPDGGARIG